MCIVKPIRSNFTDYTNRPAEAIISPRRLTEHVNTCPFGETRRWRTDCLYCVLRLIFFFIIIIYIRILFLLLLTVHAPRFIPVFISIAFYDNDLKLLLAIYPTFFINSF